MATDDKDKPKDKDSASAAFEALWAIAVALQDVAKAELAKGPGIASNAWRGLYDTVAEVMGDAPMAQASPVVGRQPVVMPPGFKNPLPVKGGAIPVRADQPIMPSGRRPAAGEHPVVPAGAVETAADIRKRADVAAELERVKKGGK